MSVLEKGAKAMASRREFLKTTLKGAAVIGTGGSVILPGKAAFALTNQQRSQAVQTAYNCLGMEYVWGAEPPDGSTDCSGLTWWCYKKAGVNWARGTAASQYTQMLYSSDTRGSLIFFRTTGTSKITHVGIITDPSRGMMIDANTAKGKVVEESYRTTYWRNCFVEAATL
jgi:cell wall-associated NlpC family hydrolase